MLLNAHAGAKYGIPFPVFVRASFGPVGANIPALLRAIVACGWFGIQSWLGGQAIAAMVGVLLPQTIHMPWVLWTCFLGFWLLNMAVVWRGVESIRFLQSFSAPFMLVISLVLLFWMLHKAGGFGPMLSAPSRFTSTRQASCTSSSLRSRRWSGTGQRCRSTFLTSHAMQKIRTRRSSDRHSAYPSRWYCTRSSASRSLPRRTVVFGEPIWSPITLLGRFHQPLVAFLGLIALLVATLNVNIAANVVSPSNDFSNLAPRLISFRTGGMITAFSVLP